ncbi:LapA family protein [uncultured Desulfovibrio sp.]|uniref:LapA family protein n=1 Tax=uncultured Desulfovibrio sp. TaxID=167968 RepID=UPI002607EF95|nr:LapA family protein [uncultured Desulfovibrio sp.]
MRFLKVLILVVAIFLALVFLFQNQTALSQDMVLTLNLFFMEPMSSIPLPLYFMLIAAFALGALLSVCFLVWDKMHGTARFMKARWRISQLEREVEKLQKQLTAEGKKQSFFQRARQDKDGAAQGKPAEKPAGTPADKPANTKPLETSAKEAETAAPVEDIVAPDPDKP